MYTVASGALPIAQWPPAGEGVLGTMVFAQAIRRRSAIDGTPP